MSRTMVKARAEVTADARVQLGLSVPALADRAGLKRSTAYKAVSGENVDKLIATRIASALRRPLRELFTYTDGGALHD